MDRSARQSLDPVRRGVHGPGVSVFGSPVRDMLTAFEKHTICIKTSIPLVFLWPKQLIY